MTASVNRCKKNRLLEMILKWSQSPGHPLSAKSPKTDSRSICKTTGQHQQLETYIYEHVADIENHPEMKN
jgi:hypothetical protein